MPKLQAYNGDEPYIFISYAHKDNSTVHPIIARMQQDGYRVWFDEGIDPGTEWDDTIAERIDSCGYFIALLSGNYMLSDNCKDELNYARDLSKKRVLVYLEDVTLSRGMAMRLNRIQSIFKHKYPEEKEFYDKLYRSDGISDFCSAPQEVKEAPTRTLTYSNGSTYTGEVNAEGKPHGRGTFRWPSGNVYEGDWVDGKRVGHGIFRWANGDLYDGDWVDDKRTRGTFRFAGGNVYEGEFKNDKYNGHGIFRTPDGTVQEGEFREGEFIG